KMNKFSYLLLFVTLVVFLSCSNDDEPEPEPRSAFPFVLQTQLPGGASGLMTAFDKLPTGDVDVTTQSNVISLASAQGGVMFGSNFFARDQNGNDGVLKYSIDENGDINEEGFIDGGQRLKATIVSETKGYYADLDQFNIQIFNPQTMQRTGEVDMSAADQGQLVQQVLYMIERDGKLFAGFGAGEAAFTNYRDSVFMAVIDVATDQLEAVRYRAGAQFLGDFWIRTRPFAIDANNDIYMTALGNPFGGGLDGQGRTSKILRIKSGETDFDPDYEWDISNTLSPHPSIVRSLVIASDGKAYTSLLAEPSQIPEIYSDPVWRYFELDLATQTGSVVNGLPLNAGFGTATLQEMEGKIIFPIDNPITEFNGFYYKEINTGETGVQFRITGGGRPRIFLELQ
ncbi:MAG: hypothetical protein AAGI07_05120, partial [Bacteroidota bacterium]